MFGFGEVSFSKVLEVVLDVSDGLHSSTIDPSTTFVTHIMFAENSVLSSNTVVVLVVVEVSEANFPWSVSFPMLKISCIHERI